MVTVVVMDRQTKAYLVVARDYQPCSRITSAFIFLLFPYSPSVQYFANLFSILMIVAIRLM